MLKDKLIHRDIKPNNILISLDKLDKNSIKLSDYGLTKELSTSMTISDTLLIMAPEVLEDEKIYQRVIYGVLVFLFIICTLKNILIMELMN